MGAYVILVTLRIAVILGMIISIWFVIIYAMTHIFQCGLHVGPQNEESQVIAFSVSSLLGNFFSFF